MRVFAGGKCRSRLLGLLALVSLLAAFSAAEAGDPSDAFTALQVQSFPEPIPLPPISLERIDGRPLPLADLRGKIVLLNFWATWCIPCRQEMPAMERLSHEYGGRGLAVVAVNFKESKDAVGRFFNELRLDFPSALDPEGATANSLAVRGLPATFLLDREGRILWKAMGSREWDSRAGRAYFDHILQASRSR